MFRFAYIALFLLLSATAAQAAESPNYCLDEEANKEWAQIYSENPNDNDIAKLFALRAGLCEMVRRKTLTIKRATEIFEKERARTVGEKKMEQMMERNKSPYS